MESSIAPHLRRPRTVPTRTGPDFRPPYPSLSARFPQHTREVVMAYLGVQWPDRDGVPTAVTEAVAALRASLVAGGAGHVDLAEYVDEAGFRTRVVIAYWTDPDAYRRWRAADDWTAPEHAGAGLGRFREVVVPTVDRFETLFSSDRLDGVARLADGLSGEIREHAYWGGARDRLPIAQDGEIAPEGRVRVTVDGPVRTVRPGRNVCLIRSGQEWTETAGEERRMYLEDVEPHLRAGMEYLRDEGLAVGCHVNRYMTVLDDDGAPTDRTFGLSWWRSMAELDTWAESHPTHLAIFRAAMRYLSTMGPAANLRLHHEVTVAEGDDTEFVYVGCHDRTGLLRAVGA
ncbi:phenylacetaldoxime dehydratase [Pseudonocardia sp. TMWB2A]|uniref:phenylacetaldoxime dehydratase family protein n=1 Tax=Pseudonocardia sp. TMWB2A TaxID=687430 RepID=UPI00307FB410